MKKSIVILAGLLLLAGCAKQTTTSVPVAPHAVFAEGMIDKIQPEGWLKEILERQRDGLAGHPEAMAYPFRPPTISTVSPVLASCWMTRNSWTPGRRI